MAIPDNCLLKNSLFCKECKISQMVESEINKRYCQSCGMPLRFDVEEYLGTNSDGSRSDEFVITA